MSIRYYILLEDHQLEPCSMWEWARWLNDPDKRRVAYDDFPGGYISTIFLGLDHGPGVFMSDIFGFEPLPIVFETMIFGGQEDQYQRRYSTWDDAVLGHAEAVALVKNNPLSWLPRIRESWGQK